MIKNENTAIIEEYKSFLFRKEYPCIAARAAIQKQQVGVFVADHMACPKDDKAILNFLYNFVDGYRNSDNLFNSAAILFKGPETVSEEEFERLLWERLQAIENMDAQQYPYDKRVSSDTKSRDFSFSIKEEAFYIIGLHPQSSRNARRFKYPGLVFNPHQQFEILRKSSRYDKMKKIVRQLDTVFSGSVNPMLQDFGNAPEVLQYSGRKVDGSWECPLKINNRLPDGDHTTT